VVVFEAEAVAMAVAVAVDEDEAIKAVSLVRKIDKINRNACQTRNISIAKRTTSTLTIAVLATLEVIAAHLVTLSATSHRPRTTKRRPSRLEAIRTARIEARNNLMAERTLYASTKTTRISTTMSIPPTAIRTTTPKSVPPSAQKTTRAPSQPAILSGASSAAFLTTLSRI